MTVDLTWSDKTLFFMKLKNILKTTGALHILLGLLIIFLLIFSVETIAGKASTETLLLVRGTADVVAASSGSSKRFIYSTGVSE